MVCMDGGARHSWAEEPMSSVDGMQYGDDKSRPQNRRDWSNGNGCRTMMHAMITGTGRREGVVGSWDVY